MAKRSKKNKTARGKGASTSAAASDIPWQSAPNAPQPKKKSTAASTGTVTRSSEARVTSSAGGGQPSSPWMEGFEYSPWISGGASQPAQPSMPMSARAKMQASQAYSSVDQISNYQNPWGDSSASASGRPLTRREAIRARAAARKKADIHTGQEQAGSAWAGKEKPEKPATTKSESTEVQHPAPQQGHSNSSQVWALKSQDISVESLPNGVINILGDGLGVVINSGVSVGKSVSKVVKAGARVVPGVAATALVGVAGVSVVYGNVSSFPLTWKIF